MKSFKRYVEEKEGLGLVNATDIPPDEALLRIAKMAIEDHQTELVEFFAKLGQRDHRIRTELEDFQRDQGQVKKRHSLPNKDDYEDDEVVPPGADGFGSETEQA